MNLYELTDVVLANKDTFLNCWKDELKESNKALKLAKKQKLSVMESTYNKKVEKLTKAIKELAKHIK